MSRVPRVTELSSVPTAGTQNVIAPNVNNDLAQISNILGQVTGLSNQVAGIFQQQAGIEERKTAEIERDRAKAERVDRGAAAEFSIAARGTMESQARQGGYDDIIPLEGDIGPAFEQVMGTVIDQNQTPDYRNEATIRLGPPVRAAILARQRELQIRNDVSTENLSLAQTSTAETESEIRSALSNLHGDLAIKLSESERAVFDLEYMKNLANKMAIANNRKGVEAIQKIVGPEGAAAIQPAVNKLEDIFNDERNELRLQLEDRADGWLDKYEAGTATQKQVLDGFDSDAASLKYGVTGSPAGEAAKARRIRNNIKDQFGSVDARILRRQVEADRWAMVMSGMPADIQAMGSPVGFRGVVSQMVAREFYNKRTEKMEKTMTDEKYHELLEQRFLFGLHQTVTSRFDQQVLGGLLAGTSDPEGFGAAPGTPASAQRFAPLDNRDFLVKIARMDPDDIGAKSDDQVRVLAKDTRQTMHYMFLLNSEKVSKALESELSNLMGIARLPGLTPAGFLQDRGGGVSGLSLFRKFQRMDQFGIAEAHLNDRMALIFLRTISEMERQGIEPDVSVSFSAGAGWRERLKKKDIYDANNELDADRRTRKMGFNPDIENSIVSDFLDTTRYIMAIRDIGYWPAADMAEDIFKKNNFIVGNGYSLDLGGLGHRVSQRGVLLVEDTIREYFKKVNPELLEEDSELNGDMMNAHIIMFGADGRQSVGMGKFGGNMPLSVSFSMTFEQFKDIENYVSGMDTNGINQPRLEAAQDKYDNEERELVKAIKFWRQGLRPGQLSRNPVRTLENQLAALRKIGRPTAPPFGIVEAVKPTIDKESEPELHAYVEFLGTFREIQEKRAKIENARIAAEAIFPRREVEAFDASMPGKVADLLGFERRD